jgi:polar amino acid transport system permease protein
MFESRNHPSVPAGSDLPLAEPMQETLSLLAWGPDGWGDELAAGTLVTVTLALATLPFGLCLGFLIALAKNSGGPVARTFGNLYTTIFRGLPELLTLLIIYYGGQRLLQEIYGYFVEDGDPIEVNAFVAGMVALGFVFSAYSSEVFYGAFKGITQGQIEASRALGLSRFLTLRFVIFPQLWRFALPGIANLWLILLKETSLVSVIALPDLLRTTFVAVGVTKQPFLFFLAACMIYLVLSMISSVGIGRIEAWSNRGERARA